MNIYYRDDDIGCYTGINRDGRVQAQKQQSRETHRFVGNNNDQSCSKGQFFFLHIVVVTAEKRLFLYPTTDIYSTTGRLLFYHPRDQLFTEQNQ
jgi:hypothetical protein